MTGSSAAAQHLRGLALLRRVRDRIDREYAQLLDVEALARGVNMSAGHLSRQVRLAAGMPACLAKQVTRPIRNREAAARQRQLA